MSRCSHGAPARRAQAKLRAELDARLAKLLAEKHDAWSFNHTELVEEDARLYSTKTFYTLEDYFAFAAEKAVTSAKSP